MQVVGGLCSNYATTRRLTISGTRRAGGEGDFRHSVIADVDEVGCMSDGIAAVSRLLPSAPSEPDHHASASAARASPCPFDIPPRPSPCHT